MAKICKITMGFCADNFNNNLDCGQGTDEDCPFAVEDSEIDRTGEFCLDCGGFTGGNGCTDCLYGDTVEAILYKDGTLKFIGG